MRSATQLARRHQIEYLGSFRADSVWRIVKTASATSAGRPNLRQLLPPSDRKGACEKVALRTAMAIIATGRSVAHFRFVARKRRLLGIVKQANPTIDSSAATLGVISNQTR
jgi:hypothetical protein